MPFTSPLHQKNCRCHAAGARLCRFTFEELLTPDIQGVKSIRSVGAVFEKILLRLGVLEGSSDQGRALLVVLVLAETKPATIHLRRLNCKNQVVIVLTVEHRHEALLSSKATVLEVSSVASAERMSRYFSSCFIGLPI